MYSRPRISRTRRIGSIAMALAVVALAAGSLYGTVSLVEFGARAGVRWDAHCRRQPAPSAVGVAGGVRLDRRPAVGVRRVRAVRSVEPALGRALHGPVAEPHAPSRARSGSTCTGAAPSSASSPRSGACPRPCRRRPTSWIIAAGKKPDRTRARQERLFKLSRSLFPAPDKAAEPEGWAAGLTKLGYGKYKVTVHPSIKAAIKVAAKALRTTNRPVGPHGLARGAQLGDVGLHVHGGPGASRAQYTVTAVYIEDVWYPRHSNIWGDSRKPDVLVPVGKLPEDFKPWKRPQKKYPDKDGRFVIVVPVP